MTTLHSNVLVIDSCPETQARIVDDAQGRGCSINAPLDPSSARATIDLAAPDLVITDRLLPEGRGHALPRAQHRLLGDLAERPEGRPSEYRLTMDFDPAHVPRVVSWLLRTTAATLPEIQRLHMRGALHELLLNAVEHGTLELGFQMKQRALAEGRYEAVLRRRVAESRFKDRQITIQVYDEKEVKRLTYCIIDEGKGFMWRRFLTQSPDAGRTAAVSGRGIFLARSYFPSLTYNDRGNEVTITVPFA
ncbi:MAG: ATP-binding protein [Nitrospiraceae bacterium]